MKNISQAPVKAVTSPGSLMLRMHASNSNGYFLISVSLEDSPAAALAAAFEKWKEISPRCNFLVYEIYSNGHLLDSGKIGPSYHYKLNVS